MQGRKNQLTQVQAASCDQEMPCWIAFSLEPRIYDTPCRFASGTAVLRAKENSRCHIGASNAPAVQKPKLPKLYTQNVVVAQKRATSQFTASMCRCGVGTSDAQPSDGRVNISMIEIEFDVAEQH